MNEVVIIKTNMVKILKIEGGRYEKVILTTLALLLLITILTGCGSETKETYISIATGGPAGTYYPFRWSISKNF